MQVLKTVSVGNQIRSLEVLTINFIADSASATLIFSMDIPRGQRSNMHGLGRNNAGESIIIGNYKFKLLQYSYLIEPYLIFIR